jgi:hypothetical protein
MDYTYNEIPQEILKKLEKLIKETKFGSVTIVIQDGHIVQIETNEKLRFK